MQIMILDDHPLVREGMISILTIKSDKNCIYQAGTIAAGLEIVKTKEIDVVLVDLFLGRESGFDFIVRAKALNKAMKYVIITSSTNEMDLDYAMELGVDGYLVKDAFVEEIVYALDVIMKGKKYYSNSMMCRKVNETVRTQPLTKREREVLMQLKEGRTNAEISEELCISETTTKKHVSNILAKLNLRHRVDAVLYTMNQ